jgi:hypothetical protein
VLQAAVIQLDRAVASACIAFRAAIGVSAGRISRAGAVTRTKFGRVKIGSLSSGSGRCGGSPRPERFVSEDAERAAGCEMALDIERVLDGGVNRQESLG